MRILSLFLLLHVMLFATTSVEKKIDKSQKNLQTKAVSQKTIGRKLSEVAKDIQKEQKNLTNIKSQTVALKKSIVKNENIVKNKEIGLKELTSQNTKLTRDKKELETRIIKIIAEDLSFYLISDKKYQDSIDSILVEEAVNKISIIMQKEIAGLSKEYKAINEKIDKQNLQIKGIKSSIKEQKDKRVRYSALQTSKERSIKKLNSKEKSYKNRLLKIKKERNKLRSTLKKLKIIKDKEDKAKLEKRAEPVKRTEDDARVSKKMTVRQIGSSFQNSRVKRYRGKKTIAPLDDFTIKRKFGKYTDPIYKIKIFNESVVLAPKKPNAKVRNVLSGRVVFAKDTAVLDKVIIVENSYGIHTVYANLSRIAPTVEVGKRVKKGYVIGRVQNSLSFEVTQKSYHINPMELIRH